MRAVGVLPSQQLLIVCSCTKISEQSFTEFLGLVLPRTDAIKTPWKCSLSYTLKVLFFLKSFKLTLGTSSHACSAKLGIQNKEDFNINREHRSDNKCDLQSAMSKTRGIFAHSSYPVIGRVGMLLLVKKGLCKAVAHKAALKALLKRHRGWEFRCEGWLFSYNQKV